MRVLSILAAAFILMGAAASPKTEHDCTLTVEVYDYPGRSDFKHWCHTTSETLEMKMPADYKPGQKNLKTGQKIKVRGKRNVDSAGRPTLELDGADVQYLTVPAGNPSYSTIPNDTIVIAVSFSNQPSPLTAAELKPYYVNTVNSVAREMSQGLMYLRGIKTPSDPADFVDVTIALPSGGCDVLTIVGQALTAAKAKGYTNGSDLYHRLVYHIPASPCGWSGLSTLGWYGGYSIINGQQDVSPTSVTCRVVCHEVLGHAVAGQYHSHSNTLNSVNCCIEEYGDSTDYMGASDGVLNPWQRKVALWFDGINLPGSHLVTIAGDYDIVGLTEPGTTGFKALRIPSPSDPNTELWVAYYTQKGHYGQIGKPAGVFIHSGGTVGGSSYLLACRVDPGVVWPCGLGDTFNYLLAPVSITVKALNATQAQIHVEFGAPPPPPSTGLSFTVTK